MAYQLFLYTELEVMRSLYLCVYEQDKSESCGLILVEFCPFLATDASTT